MVSIENRIKFARRIEQNPKLTAFSNLVNRKPVHSPDSKDLHESDENYYELLSSISANNKEHFIKVYQIRSKSKPNKDSIAPFINDDYLIFCLMLGIMKFGIDESWIKNILSIRNRNPITITFDNILSGNFYSKSNLPEIVLSALQILNEKLIQDDLLNEAYKGITNNLNLFESKNDFLIICAIRAYDLIIEFKLSPSGTELHLLHKFKSVFLKRMKILGFIVHLFVWLIILYGILKLLSKVDSISDFIQNYDTMFTVLGALGLSFFGNIIPKIRIKTYEILLRLFGYPKDLMSKTKEV